MFCRGGDNSLELDDCERPPSHHIYRLHLHVDASLIICMMFKIEDRSPDLFTHSTLSSVPPQQLLQTLWQGQRTVWTERLDLRHKLPAVWTHPNCHCEATALTAGPTYKHYCVICILNIFISVFVLLMLDKMSPIPLFGFSIWKVCCPWKHWLEIIKRYVIQQIFISARSFPFQCEKSDIFNTRFFSQLEFYCLRHLWPEGRRLSEIIPSCSVRLTGH